ncbi:DUF4810 domain-containing protein [Nitratidesulfovibrio liaohensis]|uniref:DUF4810 domain-containing protein n=1 Tax=Nitratidesulfovibrio liaohensis TaxID=2604158 RepID=UPI00141FBA22|nr:DUF4810 domain-containing protein [Nitratidesulfovibrio liaohensis]NHZ45455.1 DUF4810 domain-containing protein [Nitratidesulfovibrio liaohensis]
MTMAHESTHSLANPLRAAQLALLAAALCVLCTGCAKPNAMYCMDNYSSTLYACRKNPAQEQQDKHVKAMQDIVAKSEQRNLRVPPGIFAELGYISLKAGQMADAKKYFEAENRLYPESKVFTTRLLAWADASSGTGAEKPAADGAATEGADSKGGVITPADAMNDAPVLPAGEGAAHE